MEKLSNRIRVFLEYTYHGDGKYYLLEAGSRHYNQSSFTHFEKNNSDCFKIVNKGNDAPRGGQLGDYVEVEFNDLFMERFGWWFDEQKTKEEKRKQYKADKLANYNRVKNEFSEYCKNNPDKVEAWKTELSEIYQTLSSKKIRLWKENKVGRCTRDSNFWGKYRIFDEFIN